MAIDQVLRSAFAGMSNSQVISILALGGLLLLVLVTWIGLSVGERLRRRRDRR